MKLIVLDERQERIIRGYLTLLSHNELKESTNALVQDIISQLCHNVVSVEDIEKILDAGVDIIV